LNNSPLRKVNSKDRCTPVPFKFNAARMTTANVATITPPAHWQRLRQIC